MEEGIIKRKQDVKKGRMLVGRSAAKISPQNKVESFRERVRERGL